MVTGASTADLAIILVDATRGLLRQTRRHSTIVRLLGIRKVVLAVNKMDLVGYDQARFDKIVADYRAFADETGMGEFTAIPMSALGGENVASRSAAMPWYSGEVLLEHLECVPVGSANARRGSFNFPVQWVNRPNSGFRGYAGRLTGGSVKRGDAIRILPSHRRSTVDRIVTFNGDLDYAVEGQSVTLTLADQIDCSRGDVIVADSSPLRVTSRIGANLVWMAEASFVPGKSYWLKIGATTTSATVESIHHLIDVDSGRPTAARLLGLNDIGYVHVRLDRTVPASTYADSRELGAFILIDKLSRETVAAGMIDAFPGPGSGDENAEANRIYWVGSSMVAEQARRLLQQMGRPAFVLDEAALGELSDPDPAERIRRARAAAVLLGNAGVTVVVSMDVPASEYWPGLVFDTDQLKNEGADEWVI
jgi:bifunctional enzyme CysN/CysC